MILRQPQQINRLKAKRSCISQVGQICQNDTLFVSEKGKKLPVSLQRSQSKQKRSCQSSVLSSSARTRWVLGVNRNNIYERNYKERVGRERVRTWEDTNSKLPKNWQLEKFLSGKHPHLLWSPCSPATVERTMGWKSAPSAQDKRRLCLSFWQHAGGLLALMAATIYFWGHCFWKRLLLSRRVALENILFNSFSRRLLPSVWRMSFKVAGNNSRRVNKEGVWTYLKGSYNTQCGERLFPVIYPETTT